MSIEAAEDWEATRIIYCSSSGFDQDEQQHGFENDRIKKETTTTTTSTSTTTTTTDNAGGLLWGSIELKFNLQEFVFGREVRPFDAQMPRYRFWVLRSNNSNKSNNSSNYFCAAATTTVTKRSSKPSTASSEAATQFSSSSSKLCTEKTECSFRFQLVFWCHPSQQQQEQQQEQKPSNDDVISLYDRVEIKLLSPYPHSFPQEQKQKWLQWLQEQATTILKEEQISYSVCDFVQHRVLDFFPRLLTAENDKKLGNLIVFEDDGPLFYDLPTISTTTTVKQVLPLQRQYPNGSKELLYDTSSLSRPEQDLIVPLIVHWKSWLPIECPICFDIVLPQHAVIVTCNHGFCKSCLTQYLRIKATEITLSPMSSTAAAAATKTKITNKNNGDIRQIVNNPFVCPIVKCRRGMKIKTCVRDFLTKDLLEKVKNWYRDIKNPPSYALDRCLKINCSGKVLRKEAIDSYLITCEVCNGRWCELCLQRAPKTKQISKSNKTMVRTKNCERIQQQKVIVDEHTTTPGLCKAEECLAFCERYLAAGEKGREACRAKWPWIQHYAKYRVHDDSINDWIKSSGARVCPGCRMGIERLEGCFHMSCQCGTHFCYECGEGTCTSMTFGVYACLPVEQRTKQKVGRRRGFPYDLLQRPVSQANSIRCVFSVLRNKQMQRDICTFLRNTSLLGAGTTAARNVSSLRTILSRWRNGWRVRRRRVVLGRLVNTYYRLNFDE